MTEYEPGVGVLMRFRHSSIASEVPSTLHYNAVQLAEIVPHAVEAGSEEVPELGTERNEQCLRMITFRFGKVHLF